MPWGEPECVFHSAASLAIRRLCKRWRSRRFLPCAAEIGRAMQRRTKVTGAGCGQQRLAVARIKYQMVDNVAQKMGPVRTPFTARRVAVKKPGALARSDEEYLILL